MTDSQVSLAEIERLVAGEHHDPHSILGAHPGPDGIVIRALRPLATSVTLVLDDGRRVPMTHLAQGVFAVTLPDEKVPDYRIATSYGPDGGDEIGDRRPVPVPAHDRRVRPVPDRGRPARGAVEGARRARPQAGPVTGTSFAVWAPNARGVRVTGDFNFWDGRGFPMRSLGGTGVWELFVPERGRRAPGTSTRSTARTACGGTRPTRWPTWPSGRPPPRRWCITSRYSWGDAEWTGRPRRAAAGARADERVRGAPRLVAARPVLPRAGRRS